MKRKQTTTTSNGSPQRQAAMDALRHRKQSYCQTFNPENRANQVALTDLARFCRAGKSTFDPDPRVHALLEGRKEVFIRIADHLGMNEHELFRMFVEGE